MLRLKPQLEYMRKSNVHSFMTTEFECKYYTRTYTYINKTFTATIAIFCKSIVAS